MELELPATEYEMLDLMEQLRLKPGQIPYLEILEFYDYEYLAGRIQELPDVFQLNTLAKRLAELEIHGMAAFEGLVSMELQKGGTRLSILHLIDFAYSEDCCHVVEDPMTDCQLGRFLRKTGLSPRRISSQMTRLSCLTLLKSEKSTGKVKAAYLQGSAMWSGTRNRARSAGR